MTIKQAADTIESYVADWDPSVSQDAAEWALSGASAWTFPGRPHDDEEMAAFVEAFEEIQKDVVMPASSWPLPQE